MKKVIIALCFITITKVNAQVFSAGLFKQQLLSKSQIRPSNQGIELSSNMYFASINAGMGWGLNSTSTIQQSYLGVDFTPNTFHHAYLAPKFAPFAGFQFNRTRIKQYPNSNSENTQSTITLNNRFNGNVGFKFSQKRFIGSVGYQFGQNNNAIVVRMALVVGVTNRCLRKRLLDYDMRF
jgi:hypothetical protein